VKNLTRFLLLLAILTGASAFGQVTASCNNGPCSPITTSGGTLVVPNLYGGMSAAFEEIVSGTPASVSITVQGCMRGGTCDSAMDTNTLVGSAIRSVVPVAKPYGYFLVTATWSGGTNPTVQINPVITSAKVGGGGNGAFVGGLGSSFQDVAEIVAPGNPGAGNDRLYLNSTTHLLTCLTSSGVSCMPSGGTPAFSAIGAGTNAAALLVGTGGSLGPTGTGVITSTNVQASAGFAPTVDGVVGVNTTNHTFVNGSNGATMVGAVAATGTGVATTCTNQVVTVVSAVAAPTCTSLSFTFLPLSAMGTITGGTWQGTAVATTFGGTGLDSHLSTGVAQVAAGTWTVSTTLPSGLSATNLTLVTPALGTPASGVATNITGLPIATGVSGLGTGIATFLATPSSANLFSAMTTKTGSGGSLVFATAPTLASAILSTAAQLSYITGATQCLHVDTTGAITGTGSDCGSGAGGGVSTFSAGTLSPLFTTSVATPTTTPALSFVLSNAAANTVFANFTGSSAAPSYSTINGGASCGDATHALAYTNGTGFGCQAISVGGSPAWSAVTNPAGNLALTMGANTSTFNTTTAVAQFFKWANTTAALSGASQSSPILSLCGTEWHAAASVEGCLALQFIPGTGTDAASTFAVTHTGTATGAPTTTFPGPLQIGTAGSVGGGVSLPEGTALTASASSDVCYADSTAHAIKCSFNNDTSSQLARFSNNLGAFASTTSAQLLATVSDETGTGALVFGTAPVITLANGTGLPISTGVSGLGTGVATFLATPSSANLFSALTTKTGSGGSVVFATGPTISSVVLSTAAQLSYISGSTQCLHVDTTGAITGTGADCGAGGGSVNSISNSDGTLTISPTTGTVVSSIALGHANTWTATQTFPATSLTGSEMVNNTVTATQLAAQYSKGSCTEVWGGSGASFAMASGDDAISNNTCYNDSGVTRTITAVKCRADNAANTTVLTPTFGASGTGTSILTGTVTCGNSYAYSATGTLTNTAWTTGTGINPGMSTVGNATSIALIIEYTF
jgi:hypothetical protein